jgi:hypothetical protein
MPRVLALARQRRPNMSAYSMPTAELSTWWWEVSTVRLRKLFHALTVDTASHVDVSRILSELGSLSSQNFVIPPLVRDSNRYLVRYLGGLARAMVSAGMPVVGWGVRRCGVISVG